MISRLWPILCLIMVGSACACGASADQAGRGKEQVMANIFINNATELANAISSSKGGETYILSPGDYGSVKIHNLNLDNPITIRSQNLSNLAHFDFLDVYLSKNVVISDIDLGSPLAPGEAITMWSSAIRVRSSSEVTLDNLKVSGTHDGIHTNDRVGLYVVDSNGVNLLNTEFSDLHHGGGFSRTSNIVVSGNTIHDIRMDGLEFSQVKNVLIENNKFFDFWKQPGDHSDAMQFWTSGTTVASSDIEIRNNLIFQGMGLGQQGIFFRDELGTLPFQRVLIENNLIYQSTEYNGMSFNGGNDIRILSNTVVSAEHDNFRPFMRVQNVSNGEVAFNVADFYIDDKNTNVVFHDNVDISKDLSIMAQLPTLQSITSVDVDGLILPGAGYQPPEAPGGSGSGPAPEVPSAGPVGGLLGSAIGDHLSMIGSSLVAQEDSKIEILQPSSDATFQTATHETRTHDTAADYLHTKFADHFSGLDSPIWAISLANMTGHASYY